MKEVIKLIPAIIGLITPDPAMKGVRLKRKELKIALKNIRIAERMYKSIYKEFKKDGFSDEETDALENLRAKIVNRRMELI